MSAGPLTPRCAGGGSDAAVVVLGVQDLVQKDVDGGIVERVADVLSPPALHHRQRYAAMLRSSRIPNKIRRREKQVFCGLFLTLVIGHE